ncbi:DNA-binding protein [Schleiferilactobacillus harbinensis]|uniref:DNA-binding protein n=1 Tax=Schleiferilactobacillus harbinensis TaxID=304207 RepID=UPI0039EC037C
MKPKIELQLPDDFEESIKRDMYKAALEAFQATAQKHQWADYLNRDRAAAYLGVSTGYLDKLTTLGMPTIMIDGHKLYKKSEVDKFMLSFQM